MAHGKDFPNEALEYCAGKVRYDKRGAQTAQNARFKQSHIRLRIYECPDCQGWHLTHKRAWQDNKFKQY